MIQKGKKVSLEYTVFLEDGMQIDSNVGEPPLVFVIRKRPALPRSGAGDCPAQGRRQKEIRLLADQLTVIPDAYKEVDLGSDPRPVPLRRRHPQHQDRAGGVFPIRVHEVKGAKAVLSSTTRWPEKISSLL